MCGRKEIANKHFKLTMVVLFALLDGLLASFIQVAKMVRLKSGILSPCKTLERLTSVEFL